MAKKIEKSSERRSDCPISCTLELIGDKWSMLIIRDMLLFGKCTYNEFLNSGEKISTNILNDRLISLTGSGLIEYSGAAKRKKYSLTKKGKDLAPVLEALRNFGFSHFKGSRQYAAAQMKEALNRK